MSITLKEYYRHTLKLGIGPSETEERYGYYETEQNILTNFLKALYEEKLVNENIKLIDVGCGLSTTLYNFYLQSQLMKDKFKLELYGIEADPMTAMKFEKELLPFFDGNMIFSMNEAEEISYERFDIVYLYSPMKYDGMCKLYDKIFKEIKPGTVVYDAYLYGKGLMDCIESRVEKFGLYKQVLEFGNKKHIIHVKK